MAETIHRNDYRVPSHLIDTVNLVFDLDVDSTSVINTMHIRPNPESEVRNGELVLNGETLMLVSVAVDNKPLSENDYVLTDKTLTLKNIDKECDVTVVNRFSPASNKALSGIYTSGPNLMSQCESEGFRRITYYLDRPDVLARFSVVIRASKDQFPILLSNGNRIEEKDLEDGRHEARWDDPFLKPSYLFALVAGNLTCRREVFPLKDGRNATLEVWVEPQDADKTAHTLESLKKAIRWDEERWGLELDLDHFAIVATNDFNFGAMENKGLNIFNARYALANPKLATDSDYHAIESVVGHEYFHNWTGDRVTLRDWFQLTLKEGLTVFRDQEFSADMLGSESARAVERIKNVRALRAAQFAEDASPMAHPIRPESYQEINNFYTATVYEKGAEVIRMLQTLLGRDTFRRGFDLYIQKNDGRAVTCEAFINAMEEASGRSLEQFSRWYSQAGTPRVSVTGHWDEPSQTYTLTAEQSTPATPGQPLKEPFLMPFPIALLDSQGNEMPLVLEGETSEMAKTFRMFELSKARHTWVFTGIPTKPVPSLNRGFAAPIILDIKQPEEELALLARADKDPFNRYEAMNRLMMATLLTLVRSILVSKQPSEVSPILIDAFTNLLKDDTLSPAFRAVAMSLPSERAIADQMPVIDPEAIHQAREYLRKVLAVRSLTTLQGLVDAMQTPGAYSPDPESAGKRALKNACHSYLIISGSKHPIIAIRDQLLKAENLTDKLAALTLISHSDTPTKNDLSVQALQEWINEPLLINKWLTIQATSPCFKDETPLVDRLKQLVRCNFFSITNPNNVYALLLAFFSNNPSEFHRLDGTGYQFWSEVVLELDKHNPHVAARVARCLENWRRYTPDRADAMFRQLKFLESCHQTLSDSVNEIINKALHNPV